MKGLWLENGILQYRADIPEPEVPEGEALIQILLAGICSTDLELVKGYYPFRGVLGHEFVGRVISSGIETIQVDDVYPRMADVVVEATGSPDGLSLAKRAVRPRGTIVLKSTYKGDVKVNFSEIVVDEITLIGSRCGAFEPALRLLARGMIKPDVLIDGKYHLEDGIQAFEKAASPGTLKILISPD